MLSVICIIFVMKFLVSTSLSRQWRCRPSVCQMKSRFAIYSRPTANDACLDANLIANSPDLVLSHLTSRKSNSDLVNQVLKISSLRSERNSLIIEGDKAKNKRKTLSQEIGIMMKSGAAEVDELKDEVKKANEISSACDLKLQEIDGEIEKIISVLPNLLDDRYDTNVSYIYYLDQLINSNAQKL